MAQTYFPFDSGQGSNVTELQWSKMAQNWLATGVIRGALNELQVYADSTGMQIKVKSGRAWINGHFYESDAIETLPLATADASNPRVDRIIVRLDWVTNTIQLAVLQGNPAALPQIPALTQNSARWEIGLAQIYINANVATIVNADLTDERPIVRNASDGYGLAVSGADLNQLTAPGPYTGNNFSNPPIPGDVNSYRILVEASGITVVGQLATKLSTGQRFSRIQTSLGNWTVWEELLTDKSKSWSNLTLQNGASVFSSRTPRYTKFGKKVEVEGEINGIAAGTVIGTLPSGYRPPVLRSFKVSQNWSSSNDGATIYVDTNGTITVQTLASTGQSISLMGISFNID